MKAAFGQCVDWVDISPVVQTYYSCLLAAFNNPQLFSLTLKPREKAVARKQPCKSCYVRVDTVGSMAVIS